LSYSPLSSYRLLYSRFTSSAGFNNLYLSLTLHSLQSSYFLMKRVFLAEFAVFFLLNFFLLYLFILCSCVIPSFTLRTLKRYDFSHPFPVFLSFLTCFKCGFDESNPYN